MDLTNVVFYQELIHFPGVFPAYQIICLGIVFTYPGRFPDRYPHNLLLCHSLIGIAKTEDIISHTFFFQILCHLFSIQTTSEYNQAPVVIQKFFIIQNITNIRYAHLHFSPPFNTPSRDGISTYILINVGSFAVPYTS